VNEAEVKAQSIIIATTHYQDAALLAEACRGLDAATQSLEAAKLLED